jgi:exosortase A-associated hydrolase 2
MQPQLFFLATDTGKLLITQFLSAEYHQARLNVIAVPPFCEEMNKSRKMLATFARYAAKNNIRVSLIDLFGTGDSEGNLCDATWSIWQKNIVALYQYLQQKHPEIPIAILGLRTGGLLALDCCVRKEISAPLMLMLWQPVLNGQQYINQFMRLRLAAEMFSKQPKCTINELLDQLHNTGVIEIAGYDLSQTLSEQISTLNYLELAQLPPGLKLGWLEIGLPPKQELLPISQKVISKWQQHNVIWGQFVIGDSFWQTQEITIAKDLVDPSVGYLLESLSQLPAMNDGVSCGENDE